jgi:hypothetical protein
MIREMIDTVIFWYIPQTKHQTHVCMNMKNVYGTITAVQDTDTDTDISQHTPYQGFSVTGYIMNR